VALDQSEGEILVRTDERDAIPLDEREIRRVRPQRLPFEDEIGDSADELLNGGRDVRPQFQRGHSNSVYRRNQEMVKHWKIFSERSHNLLG
jgi:hypothetical protein